MEPTTEASRHDGKSRRVRIAPRYEDDSMSEPLPPPIPDESGKRTPRSS
jgi:hypothetical protein